MLPPERQGETCYEHVTKQWNVRQNNFDGTVLCMPGAGLLPKKNLRLWSILEVDHASWSAVRRPFAARGVLVHVVLFV